MTYHLKCEVYKGNTEKVLERLLSVLDARSIGSMFFSESFPRGSRFGPEILGFGPEILGAVRGLGLRAQVGQRAQAFRGQEV